MKNIRVLSENFQFLEGKFSIYIFNMHVIVMLPHLLSVVRQV